MEAFSEQERYEHQALPRDVIFTPEQLSLQALIDHLAERNTEGE